MNRSFILIFLALFTILAISACNNRSSEPTDTTDISSSSEPVVVSTTHDSTQSSTHESDPTNTPTPTAAVLPFAFDLTDEEITETESPLLFIAGMDSAVVIGGEDSPFTKKASLFSGIDECDWNETGIDNYNCQYSIDRSEVAFCVDDSDGTGKLTYFDGTDTQNVASKVDNYALSLTGNAIAYTVWGNDAIPLYMYDCGTGKSRLLCDDINFHLTAFCISPAGDAVAYNDPDYSLYVVRGDADPVLVSGDCFPVGVSNGGELVYYTKKVMDKWTLYVYTKGSHICLGGADSEGGSTSSYCDLIFNRDLTQVLIAINNKVLFSKDGSKAVCITDITDDMNNGDSAYWKDSEYNFICRSKDTFIRNSNISFLPVKNLCSQLYRFADTLLYLDSNLDARYLSSQTPEYGQESSRNGYQLAYMVHNQEYDGNDLYYMADFRDSGSESKVPIEYAENAVITKNQSLYIENDIGQLFVVLGSNSPLLIDTYADLIGQYEVNGTTYIYYTKVSNSDFPDSSDVDLYCMEDIPNSKPKKVSSEILGAYIDYTGIYTYKYSTFDGEYESWYWDINYSTDGRNFFYLSTKEFGV